MALTGNDIFKSLHKFGTMLLLHIALFQQQLSLCHMHEVGRCLCTLIKLIFFSYFGAVGILGPGRKQNNAKARC